MRFLTLAALLLVVVPRREIVIIQRIEVAVPQPVVAPAPPPAPPPAVVASTSTACPALVRDAASPNPAHFPAGIEHVVASITDANVVAAWNATHIYVTRDGGKTFSIVLDGPGAVSTVAFDCFGHAIAVRGDRLGVREEHDTWHVVPGLAAPDPDSEMGTPVLVGGGPDVVLAYASESNSFGVTLGISHDRGVSWAFHTLSTMLEHDRATGQQDADGTIHFTNAYADCMSDPLVAFKIEGDAITSNDTWAPSGRIFTRGTETYGGSQWRTMAGDWQPLTGIPDEETPLWVGGGVIRAIAGDAIYAVERGALRRLREWPHDAAPQTVDRAGRVWGIDHATLIVR